MRVIQTITLVVSISIFTYICTLGIKNIIRYNGFGKELSQVQSELKQEQTLQEELNYKIQSLEKKSTWELLAKQQLGYVKKDERVYKVVR